MCSRKSCNCGSNMMLLARGTECIEALVCPNVSLPRYFTFARFLLDWLNRLERQGLIDDQTATENCGDFLYTVQ